MVVEIPDEVGERVVTERLADSHRLAEVIPVVIDRAIEIGADISKIFGERLIESFEIEIVEPVVARCPDLTPHLPNL